MSLCHHSGVPPAPLLPRSGRRLALVVIAVAVLIFVALAVWLHGVRDTGIDDRITRWVYAHVRRPLEVEILDDLTSPTWEVIVLTATVVAACALRHWRVAAFAALGPAVSVLAGEGILKPLIHRPRGGGSYPVADAFPSGHETGLVSMLTVFAVLLVRTAWTLAVKVALLVVMGAWTVLGAVGLVRIFAHYPTDTVGAVCSSVAVVLMTALVIDRIAERRVSGPAAPDPPRTASVA
jgi:undecaprenyl-diphosphatase